MADGSLSQFKATLARKLERSQKRQARADRNTSYNSSGAKPKYNFPELSESELEKVKSDIRKKLETRRKRELIFTAVIFFVIVIMVLLFL